MDPRSYKLNARAGDPRDWQLPKTEAARQKSLPSSFSLPTVRVYDQGSIGSCCGNAGAVVLDAKAEWSGLEPSRMWIYMTGKEYDEFAGSDYSGTSVSGACAAMVAEGTCEEKWFPYVENEKAQHQPEAPANAWPHRITAYYYLTLDRVDDIKALLMNGPLWTSFRVHEKFYEAGSSGIVPTEGYLESKFAGGHSVAMVGWTTIDGVLYWEFQNSWSSNWGKNGRFIMAADLFSKLVYQGVYTLTTESEAPVVPVKVSRWERMLLWLKKVLQRILPSK